LEYAHPEVGELRPNNVFSMRGAVHPLLHDLSAERSGRLPDVGLLVQIFAHASNEAAMQARHSVVRLFAVRVDVSEEAPPKHVAIVGARYRREHGVAPQRR
jgi:hypothetical protein